MKLLLIISRYLSAIILLQTLYFKFTGAEESVYIFTTLGLEPYGRIIIGIIELVAAILLIIPKYSVYGAIISIVIISGAIFSHLTKLGIVVLNDGGFLFILALIVFICSFLVLYLQKNKLLTLLKN